jgi:enoyl-CoA hydratase/carnithine racemase
MSSCAEPAGALRMCKRLLKQPSIEHLKDAVKAETEEFSARLHPADAKEAFKAFFEKRLPAFTRTRETAKPA